MQCPHKGPKECSGAQRKELLIWSEIVKQSFPEETASYLALKIEKEIREEEGKGIQGRGSIRGSGREC